MFKTYKNFSLIILSCIFDIDHVIGYVYDRRKRIRLEIPKLYQLAYRPRSWFHSLPVFVVLVVISSFFIDWKLAFIALASHLVMDASDKVGIWVFPFISKKKIRGSLPVSYLVENPKSLEKHKRGHVPSLAVATIFLLLTLLT